MEKIETARLLADRRYMSGWRPEALVFRTTSKPKKSQRKIGLLLAPTKTSVHEVYASHARKSDKNLIYSLEWPRRISTRPQYHSTRRGYSIA